MAISKYSRQRELIYNTVIENKVHPTAEFVYNYLKKDNPQLSLGTVYRNLQQLSDNGEIKRLSIPNQPDRFDGIIEKHYHAVCEKCGRIYDIHINEMPEIDKLVAEKTGLDITGHEIIFKTICPMCKN
ncbi:MAG: transcriptional repressor [Mucispirillum sp.]|nr:transcriptional repressor [Mucispirillum sp.]